MSQVATGQSTFPIDNFSKDIKVMSNEEIYETYFEPQEHWDTIPEFQQSNFHKIDRLRNCPNEKLSFSTYLESELYVDIIVGEKERSQTFFIECDGEYYPLHLNENSKITSMVILKKGSRRYLLD
jgi:hypothetical protein